MKVGIYIHGVPNGQRIWGTGGDDQVINQFYGAGSEEQTKFLAEVRKSGGQNYCYYSLLKYKNVIAENGRAGSYFGLTIKMDMVCMKVKTIFQILDMTYNNAVVGVLLKQDGERLRYMVSDFKEKENHCKAIVDKIIALLGQSVDGNDVVSITPSMLSGKGCPRMNIAEYTSEKAFASISQNGSVAVSPEYPSVQLASYINKKDAEMNMLRQQSQEDIRRIQQQAQRDVEQTMARYADVDKRLMAYDQQVKQMDRENGELQNMIRQLKQGINERDNTIAKLRNTSHGTPYGGTTMRTPGFMEKLATRVLPFVNLLIVIAVLVVMYFMMPSDNSKRVKQISNDLTELKEMLMQQNDTVAVDTVESIGIQSKE